MVILIAQYLLIGVIIGFALEHVIRWVGEDVSHIERFMMIVLWPIMTLVFIFNFIKGLMS